MTQRSKFEACSCHGHLHSDGHGGGPESRFNHGHLHSDGPESRFNHGHLHSDGPESRLNHGSLEDVAKINTP